MAIIDHIFAAYRFNFELAGTLVADISPAQMVQQPAPGMNHAAWILGHLSMPRVWARERLKIHSELPANWLVLFNMGSTPVADITVYPGKAELLAALAKTHELMEQALRGMSEAELDAPPDQKLRRVFPHIGDGLIGLVTTHESYHLGQLSAWRRAIGLDRVMEPHPQLPVPGPIITYGHRALAHPVFMH